MKPCGRKLAFGWAVVLLTVVGCARRVTPIGPGSAYEPDEREQRLWEVSEQFAADLSVPGVLREDPQLESYLRGVLRRVLDGDLSQYRPLKPRVRIVDSALPNAFALAHGDVFVHTGLLGRIRDEAQLALVLGHEISHATHRHTYVRLEDKYARTGTLRYMVVLSGLGGGGMQDRLEGVGALVTQAAISGYSRELERTADQAGLALIAQAGYDPRAGAAMWQRMLEAADSRSKKYSFLYATHPKMEQRAKACRKLVERMPAELLARARDVGQERYVAAAGHMILEEARTHITLGKFDLAEETLRFLCEACPDDARPRSLLGDLYRTRAGAGDRSRAHVAYYDALQRNPDAAAAHCGLGLLYMQAGSRDAALMHLRRFLELSPASSRAEYIRAYVDQLAGDR